MPDSVQQLMDQVGGPRRVLAGAVGLLALVLILAVSRWAAQPTWVPVFADLSIEMVGGLTEKLDQAGIQYRLERGGSELTVPSGDLARARVVLAKDGLPTAGRPGLELFDQPSWAMTDFTQRINYRRALEGELERTIGKMRGVEAAQVHLALHETSTFRSASNPAEASVVLRTRGGQPPSADVVQGISHLVASSVDGLQSDNVTIVDDAGRLLSSPTEPGSLLGLTSRQLAMQREIEQHVQAKAADILGELVGAGNARVQVSALVNFDRVQRTTQLLDPDRQVTATEQKAEIIPGAQGGAGSTNTATAYENSKSVESYDGAIGGVRRLTVAVLVNDRLIPPPADAKPDAKGVLPKPRSEPRTAEELARIEMLVRSAVGYDSARGDLVSVVSVPFAVVETPVIEAEAPTIVERVQEHQQLVVSLLGVIAAFVVAVMALRAVRPAPGAALTAPQMAAALPAGGAMPAALEAPRAAPMVAANAQQREKVLATVDDDPDSAARLVRAWMKE